MNREVLTARAGLSRNYDALARLTDAYDERSSISCVRAAGSDAEERAAIEVLAAGAHRQQELDRAVQEQERAAAELLRSILAYSAPVWPPRTARRGRGRHHALGRHAAPHPRYVASRRARRQGSVGAIGGACQTPATTTLRYRRRSRMAGCCMTCCRRPTPR